MDILYIHGITKVSVFRKFRCWELRLKIVKNFRKKVGRKFLFFPIYEDLGECVVNHWSENFVSTVEEFKSTEVFIEDGVFYYKPHCSIYMNNNSKKNIYFEKVEELNKYVNELKSIAPNIIIE